MYWEDSPCNHNTLIKIPVHHYQLIIIIPGSVFRKKSDIIRICTADLHTDYLFTFPEFAARFFPALFNEDSTKKTIVFCTTLDFPLCTI